jgi:hypothetical protein
VAIRSRPIGIIAMSIPGPSRLANLEVYICSLIKLLSIFIFLLRNNKRKQENKTVSIFNVSDKPAKLGCSEFSIVQHD